MKILHILLFFPFLTACSVDFRHDGFTQVTGPLEIENVLVSVRIESTKLSKKIGNRSGGPWRMHLHAETPLEEKEFSKNQIIVRTDRAGNDVEFVEGASLVYERLIIESANLETEGGDNHDMLNDEDSVELVFQSKKSRVSGSWLAPNCSFEFPSKLSLDHKEGMKVTLSLNVRVKKGNEWIQRTLRYVFKAEVNEGKEKLNPFFDIT